MSSSLKLDWCSQEAATYAVMHWHYSKVMPRTRLVRVGVWENDLFIGCVILNNSANAFLGQPYGLGQKEVAELVRVALKDGHKSTVTRIVSIAIGMLHKQSPGLRLLVSFADPEHGHHGGIYQGGNWTYAGMTTPSEEYVVGGKRYQGRALRATRNNSTVGHIEATNVVDWAKKTMDPNAYAVMGSSKHRYLYPLDAAMCAQIAPLAKPYPKKSRGTGETDNAPGTNPETGGASPTVPLLETDHA